MRVGRSRRILSSRGAAALAITHGRSPTCLSARVDLMGLRAYHAAVGERTREVAAALCPEQLGEIVNAARLAASVADGAHANARAPWLDQFFAGRTRAWFLAFLTVHNAEHLIGEALCLRGQAGVPLGL